MGVRDDIVAYCRENIGCAYDWTPSGGVEGVSYNCSYLSTCAYAAAGLEIPSWQGHQNGDGSQSDWVRWAGHWTDEPDELLPGDLVFFGDDPYDTFHVGISLGGCDMIDSVPDGGVQERELYWTFVGGGWPLSKLPEDETLPDDEKDTEEGEDAMTEIIIQFDDAHDGWAKGTCLYWSPVTGLKYIADIDVLHALDDASRYRTGKPVYRVHSTEGAPYEARLGSGLVGLAQGKKMQGGE